MNRTSIILLCLGSPAVLAAASCSQGGVDPGGGQSTGTGGGSTAGTGGTTGNTGGSGTTTGTGGAAGNATGGSGGATTGAGGTSSTGSGGAGGTSSTGSGGAADASTGSGGAAPEGGTGGVSVGRDAAPDGPVNVDVASVVPTLDGFLWVGTCSDGAAAGLDCPILDPQGMCPNSATTTTFNQRGVFITRTLDVTGTPATIYTVNFEVRGVTGGKTYSGGVLRSTATAVNEANTGTPNDGWYIGGTPTDSRWNTYELHVTPPVPSPPARPESLTGPNGSTENVYYFNAFSPAIQTQGVSMDGRHETVMMGFRASFPVTGGSRLNFVVHDSNCLGQQNCGQTVETQTACSTPRTISLAGLSSQPPASFVQPYAQPNGFHPQWLIFDVISVTTP